MNAKHPPLRDLARYLFSFLSRSTPSFVDLVKRNNPGALFLLFFYYQMVISLLPEKECWWSRRRAELMVPELELALRRNGDGKIARILAKGKQLLLVVNR